MQFIVTGGAGFIGSNIVKRINQSQPSATVTIVDDMTDGSKFRNLVGCHIVDYIDAVAFREAIKTNQLVPPDIILHQGAVTATNEMNGRLVLDNNYTFSKELLFYCEQHSVRFIYASSGAVYDGRRPALGKQMPMRPQTVYGYSKLLFDQLVEQRSDVRGTQVVGLRYFNVYGPGEYHKGAMASVAFQNYQQVKFGNGVARLFGPSHGYEAGMQERDFVHVDDVVATVMWIIHNSQVTGIFDVGTGRTEPFSNVAAAVISTLGKGSIGYVDFPMGLWNSYQAYTCANLAPLRTVGFDHEFQSLGTGVQRYIRRLLEDDSMISLP